MMLQATLNKAVSKSSDQLLALYHRLMSSRRRLVDRI